MVPLQSAADAPPLPRVSFVELGAVNGGKGKEGLSPSAVQRAPGQTRNEPRATLDGEGEQWVSSGFPGHVTPRLRERYVKPIRQALRALGAGKVTLLAVGRSFSLITGPLSPAQHVQLARPMALKDAAGPLASLSWARVKPAGARDGSTTAPPGVGGPASPAPPPQQAPLQSGLWRVFNNKCARAASAPDLLGSGQRLRDMGLQVAEARVCWVQPNAAWGEGLAAAGGRRGVEFLLRAAPEVLAAAHGKLFFFFFLISFLPLLVKQSKGGPSWTLEGLGVSLTNCHSLAHQLSI